MHSTRSHAKTPAVAIGTRAVAIGTRATMAMDDKAAREWPWAMVVVFGGLTASTGALLTYDVYAGRSGSIFGFLTYYLLWIAARLAGVHCREEALTHATRFVAYGFGPALLLFSVLIVVGATAIYRIRFRR